MNTVFGFGTLGMFLGLMMIFFPKVITPLTNWFQNKFLPRLENRYERFLRYALAKHHPRTFFIFFVKYCMPLALAMPWMW